MLINARSQQIDEVEGAQSTTIVTPASIDPTDPADQSTSPKTGPDEILEPVVASLTAT
jgi:hypothetical protein